MDTDELHVVTGGLGYSGKYIARGLIAAGARTRTMTTARDRPNSFGDRLEIRPLDFERPAELAESLRGAHGTPELRIPETFTQWTAAGTGATFRWHAWQRDSSSS